MIQAVEAVPQGSARRKNLVLAEGEKTGHKHQVAEADAADLFEKDGTLYLCVKEDSATVVHNEHKPIVLKKGIYRVWPQREYSPKAIRRVVD
jgi:hypothetical protein